VYPVTSEFLELARGSHRAVSKTEVWSGDQYLQDIDIVSGVVTMDASRSVRSSFNLTVAAEELIPGDTSSLLFPATAELRPYRGVVVNGYDYYIPLGVFSFDEVTVDSGDDGVVISIAANDLSSKWSKALSTEAVVITKGTSSTDAIAELVSKASGEGLLDLSAESSYLMPLAVYQPGTDLWGAAVSAAQASGRQLYVDREGHPTLANVPDPEIDNPVLVYDMDYPGAPVIRFTRTLSTADTYNGVVASGEGTDLVRPLTATAWNTDPNSPYYYLGPYGKKPYFYSSPLLLTLEQCEDAAVAKLRQIDGGTETMTWEALSNPAIDVYDVVYLRRSEAKVSDTFVVESITVPLDATSPMSCAGRNTVAMVGGEFV
jgi:hypothetical protein